MRLSASVTVHIEGQTYKRRQVGENRLQDEAIFLSQLLSFVQPNIRVGRGAASALPQ